MLSEHRKSNKFLYFMLLFLAILTSCEKSISNTKASQTIAPSSDKNAVIETPTASATPLLTIIETPTVNPIPSPTIIETDSQTPRGIFIYEDFKGNIPGLLKMDGDGESTTLVTRYVDGQAWSPDGTKIAFFGVGTGQSNRLYLMDADGGNEMYIGSASTIESRYSVWTPEGQQITFVGSRDKIYVVNADGSGMNIIQTNLQRGEPTIDRTIRYLDISPDGKKIVFSIGYFYMSEIYVIDITGENLTKLTDRYFPADAPTWSPDGTKIAFAGDTDVLRELYVMNADGTDITQVGNNLAPYDPVWSPDGTHLAYYIWSPDNGTQQFCIIQIDGKNKFCVGGRVRVSIHPQAWSPDGNQIVFSLGKEEKNIFEEWVVVETQTYVVNADGTGLTEISSLKGAWDVAWNPAGPNSYQPPSP